MYVCTYMNSTSKIWQLKIVMKLERKNYDEPVKNVVQLYYYSCEDSIELFKLNISQRYEPTRSVKVVDFLIIPNLGREITTFLFFSVFLFSLETPSSEGQVLWYGTTQTTLRVFVCKFSPPRVRVWRFKKELKEGERSCGSFCCPPDMESFERHSSAKFYSEGNFVFYVKDATTLESMG